MSDAIFNVAEKNYTCVHCTFRNMYNVKDTVDASRFPPNLLQFSSTSCNSFVSLPESPPLLQLICKHDYTNRYCRRR